LFAAPETATAFARRRLQTSEFFGRITLQVLNDGGSRGSVGARAEERAGV